MQVHRKTIGIILAALAIQHALAAAAMGQNGVFVSRSVTAINNTDNIFVSRAFTVINNPQNIFVSRAFTVVNTDCNGNGIPDECDADCGVPGGPCDIPGCGQSTDCNSNGCPDECESDCDFNGIPDECDIADCPPNDPTCADCNGNGIPDACDLANCAGTLSCGDCNNNSIPDECDISNGTSNDFDFDGSPDECIRWDNGAISNTFWNAPLNWDSDAVPGIGNPADNEAVIINIDNALTTLNVPASVDSIIVGPTSTLAISAGNLTIDSPNGVHNSGVFSIESGFALIADAAMSLRGTSPITMNGATALLTSTALGKTITNVTTIAGQGILDADLNNRGTVLADAAGGTLFIVGPNPKINDGVFRATSNGLLSIVTDVTGGGNLEAIAEGTLSITGVTVSNYSLIAHEGTMMFDNSTISLGNGIDEPPGVIALISARLDLVSSSVFGTDGLFMRDGTTTLGSNSLLSIANGPVLLCPDLIADPTAVAELHISDIGSRVMATDLDMCTNAILDVVGTIGLADSLTFTNTQASEWLWGASSVLKMTGGIGLPDTDPTGYGRLEVGGQDFGDDPATHTGNPAGFVGNFQLQELLIGPGAHVMLVDFVDNGNRGGVGGQAEALYVDTLRFADSAGRLNLGGLHLYYNTVIQPGGPGQQLNCPPGDSECDGDVDAGDFAGFQACAGRVPVSPACARYDLDEDGDVDADDYTIFAQSLTGPQFP